MSASAHPADVVPLVDRVVGLARGLHSHGFDVAPSDTLDAAAVLTHLDLGEITLARRSELRACLRATLVKQADPNGEFDALFDRFFPVALRAAGRHDPDHDHGGALTADGLSTGAMVDALVAGELTALAAALVEAHAGFDTGEARGEKHYVQRVLRAADLARLMMLALRDRADADPTQVRANAEQLKQLIAAEVRDQWGQTPGGLGPDDAGPADVERIEFLHASRAELERMRAVVRPLARRIATKLARRRQHAPSGRVDVRRTIRRSLGSGGVPLDVAQRRRRPHRPELYVLCDLSGSVAEFSLFTLTLMSALSAELPRTRSFVFVDAVDEITELLERTGHAIEPWQILRNENVIGATGHSDYGAVFERFWQRVGPDLGPTATVIVTGDGRSNYRPAAAGVLAELSRRCRSVFWLDPEPRAEWATHDSAIDEYRPHLTQLFEVCTLAQLEAAIERII